MNVTQFGLVFAVAIVLGVSSILLYLEGDVSGSVDTASLSVYLFVLSAVIGLRR